LLRLKMRSAADDSCSNRIKSSREPSRRSQLVLKMENPRKNGVSYIEERGKRGNWDKALEVLAHVPDVEPAEHDRLLESDG